MKSLIFTIICSIIVSSVAFSQEMNKKIRDEKTDMEILIGYCDRDALQEGSFGSYYKEYYKSYKPDKVVVKELKQLNDGADIIIVLATWCHDSKQNVPRFLKIADKCGIEEEDMTIICVDREKTGGEVSIDNLDISKVPTFIFYTNGKEKGRIIENPVETLEDDMLLILGD